MNDTPNTDTKVDPSVAPVPQELNELFPQSLRAIMLQYAAHILGYLRRRGDTNLEGEGEQVLQFMLRYRQVLPENSRLYFDILRPVVNLLLRYPEVEERERFSGFYAAQRGQLINNIRSALRGLQSQTDLMEYLTLMFTQIVGKGGAESEEEVAKGEERT